MSGKTKTTKADVEIVRELLNHPAFEDMPYNFQRKVILASEAFDRLTKKLEWMNKLDCSPPLEGSAA